MANFSRKEPIAWVSGRNSNENPMALKRKAIGPNGTVTYISLANGKAQTNIVGNSYAQLKELEKPTRGWVWYAECDECPPVEALDEKRERDDSGLCKVCAERELLIRTRVETKDKKNSDYDKLYQTRFDKLTEVLEKTVGSNQPPSISVEDFAKIMNAAPDPSKQGRSRNA